MLFLDFESLELDRDLEDPELEELEIDRDLDLAATGRERVAKSDFTPEFAGKTKLDLNFKLFICNVNQWSSSFIKLLKICVR